MKKIYAFLAAALMSASLFAAEGVPTAADIAKEYDVVNNVVFVIHFIEDAEVCNDIRFVGTPNNWGKGDVEGASESWDNCEKFAPVEGFEGWYAAELAYSEGFQGKPLQEPTDRSWTWDYQCGDKDAWVHVDGLELELTDGYAGECNIAASAAGAYIYELKYWKNHKSPCVAIVKHNYTVMLYAPDACSDMKPFISGDFNSWAAGAMNEELDDDFETVYTISFEDQEGHGFKFRASEDNWDNEMQYYSEDDDEWKKFDNYELGAEEKIVLDYSDNGKYRFALCSNEEAVDVFVSLAAPAGAPAAGIEIIGFAGWGDDDAVLLTYNAEKDLYLGAIKATSDAEFKFREAGTWDNEIEELQEDGTWKGLPNMKVGKNWVEMEGEKFLILDFSDPAQYRWKVTEGIENVVLTEKAQKVVVDGVIYIVRDNKLFNLQGAQVR